MQIALGRGLWLRVERVRRVDIAFPLATGFVLGAAYGILRCFSRDTAPRWPLNDVHGEGAESLPCLKPCTIKPLALGGAQSQTQQHDPTHDQGQTSKEFFWVHGWIIELYQIHGPSTITQADERTADIELMKAPLCQHVTACLVSRHRQQAQAGGRRPANFASLA